MLGSLAYPSLPPQMDPVQKAVLSHTFGGPLLKTKRPIISCNVCQIRFNSQVGFPAIHASRGYRGCGASCGRVGAGGAGSGVGIKGVSEDTAGGAGPMEALRKDRRSFLGDSIQLIMFPDILPLPYNSSLGD